MCFAAVLASRTSGPSIKRHIANLAQLVMPSMEANETQKVIDHLLVSFSCGLAFVSPVEKHGIGA